VFPILKKQESIEAGPGTGHQQADRDGGFTLARRRRGEEVDGVTGRKRSTASASSSVSSSRPSAP
jgi:hypothetical protein